MKEVDDIVKAYDDAVLKGKKTALATVVNVVGSSYRRPGARMLVTEDGEITGAISGGCLEGDALRKARLALMQQDNKLVIYDTTDEDDAKLGVQLGCNGIVSILFEPIKNEDQNNPINLLKKNARQRKNAVLVTAFNQNKHADQTGTCLLMNEEECLVRSNDFKRFTADARDILSQKLSRVENYEDCSVLYQFIPPVIQLVIAGAGNDAQPLVEMASILGWHVTVIDGRGTHATNKRFPKADAVLVVKPDDILLHVNADEQTAFVLMTHNYNYDLSVLQKLFVNQSPYIGVLGPKKKLERMLDDAQANGINVNKETLQKIYGPVGLDLGAETAEEIALSIVAEIKSVFSKRQAASLKNKPSAIHDNPVL